MALPEVIYKASDNALQENEVLKTQIKELKDSETRLESEIKFLLEQIEKLKSHPVTVP
jgi:chaperonin cofactor prefoldin